MTINTNPLSYNAYIQQVGVMAVAPTAENAGVYAFADAPLNEITPMILNYAENRIARDLDLLSAKASNTYVTTPGSNLLPIPIDDFIVIETLQIVNTTGTGGIATASSLTPASKEYIETVYGSLQTAGQPKVFAMVGDNFGDGADTYNNVMLGPIPNAPYPVLVYGMIRPPSLYQYASTGIADTSYTYISSYYQDMLVIASMIYVSGFQRNWAAQADDPQMPMSYEKQYQALRLGAIGEENRKKFQGSSWSSYSTPVSATPTR